MATQTHAFRLHPGQDLKKELEAFANQQQIKSGWMITCVGSLSSYHIRFANSKHGTSAQGHFEIISLHGTISMQGLHLHIALGDINGQVVGGHLLEGNLIFTTAEIVIGSSTDYEFTREEDPESGYKELVVKTSEYKS